MFYRMNPQILPSVRLVDSTIIEPPYVHKRRKSDEYIVYLIKRGIMYLIEGDNEVTLRPGDVFVLDPHFTHFGREASWCDYFYIHFKHADIEFFEEDEGFSGMLLEKRRESIQSDIFSYDKCGEKSIYIPKLYHLSDYSSLVKITELLNEGIEKNTTQLENYKIILACKIVEAFVEISRSYVSS